MEGSRKLKFICENCGRTWTSAGGSVQDYQQCKSCRHKNYACSYTNKEQNKHGKQYQETLKPHRPDLCGKCKRLGYNCMETSYWDALEKPEEEVDNLSVNAATSTTSTRKNTSVLLDDYSLDYPALGIFTSQYNLPARKAVPHQKRKQLQMPKVVNKSNKVEASVNNRQKKKALNKTGRAMAGDSKKMEQLPIPKGQRVTESKNHFDGKNHNYDNCKESKDILTGVFYEERYEDGFLVQEFDYCQMMSITEEDSFVFDENHETNIGMQEDPNNDSCIWSA